MKVCFHTLGCKVNQYETQAMRELFEKDGYSVCNDNAESDVIVINSCSVTAESDRKTRQLLRKCRKANEKAVIVLTGCMVQAFPDISKELNEADIVMGNKDFSKICEYVSEFIKTNKRIFVHKNYEKQDCFNTPDISDFEERTRAYMKIEDGCDRFCSYCIIPYSRGRVRSKSLADIKSEAIRLVNNGFCEIVLVGINLSAFGKNEDFNICDAVETLNGIEGLKRIRLGSLEPDHITDEMLTRLKNVQKFCPQFHLSLQSGSDKTLKRMNRKYDTAFYRDLINRIRKTFENASITTDIMVGFSGETDKDFNDSLEFVKKIGFARAHIFPYSRRSGTLADSFGDHILSAVKSQRAKEMSAVVKAGERNYIASLIGKEKPVLFETPEGEFAVGYTEDYIRVKVKTNKNLIGQICPVKLVEGYDDYCIGKLIKDF
ncbi:MAG: tRNA (N(6)-L-threonylcarbamoyladenosine(37)-C(2))-methylthiotransferase MtaB [Clostridia bacterium]|nr:tRNA (N(6)-L-threonylcarbamoyladenosine(37)-C(2))-methylthiotransferase MtaB [Clostridia bacterium]